MRKTHPLMVQEAKKQLEDVESFVAANLTGLTAAETTELRRDIRTAGGRIRVVRNSVARKSFEDLGREEAKAAIDGPTALAWAEGDGIVAVCKILDGWKKKSKRVGLTGGWMQGKSLSGEQVNDLAAIPGRMQLHAMVVGTLAAPLTRFVGTLNGLLGGLAIVLKKISEGRNENG